MRALAFLVLVFVPCFAADTMLPPVADQQLARDIYKQLIEIKSGFSTGATTPAAEGMAHEEDRVGDPHRGEEAVDPFRVADEGERAAPCQVQRDVE